MKKAKEFKKYNVAIPRLFEVILGMNEEQQAELLRYADKLIKNDRRGFRRKSCHVSVNFATFDRTHRGYIKNISHTGAFIATKAPIIVGEEILMIFNTQENENPVKVKGEIVHATRWGIGVEFKSIDSEIEDAIWYFISQIEENEEEISIETILYDEV